MEKPLKNVQELIAEVDRLKKQDPMDLSSDQDLTVALMNLISIEEHLFFTGAKTGKTAYYDLLNEVRAVRKELLKKVIVDYEGEVWCISKHLLAASMRLMEVGTKQLSLGRKAEAGDLFEKAYSLYTLFWGVNLEVHDTVSPVQQPVAVAASDAPPDGARKGFGARLRELVSKMINCCIE
jgi:hypothetical protein